MIPQAHIPGGQPGGGLSLPAVGQAAGLGTAPAVAAAAADEAGIPALAADAHALGPVDEHLGLDARGSHGADGVQGTFPGQHHPAHAQPLQQKRALHVMDGHLGAGMDAQLGELLPDQLQHAQILHQDGVGPQVAQHGQGLPHPRQLPFLHQGIDGDVHPAAQEMAQLDDLPEPLPVKARVDPRAKGRRPQVQGVGAVAQCGQGSLPAARGTQ